MEKPSTSDEASQSRPQTQSSASAVPPLEDCLKLLRGERDEQRLAGLLLVTKFCNKDDHATTRRVYDAVSPQFLHRLLRTGMGKGGGGAENRDVYLQLSLTILAAFCRVHEIAASDDMVQKIPMILEIILKESESSILEECYEILFLVLTASEHGITAMYESGGMNIVASQIASMPDGSHMTEFALRIIQLMTSKLSQEEVYAKHPSELAVMVAGVAKQFAMLQDAQKFEALHLLSSMLSYNNATPLSDALRGMPDDTWATNMRIGVVAILQNRVAPAEKFEALVLADCMTSILSEGWLIGAMNLPDAQESFPADRCILLVLESSRVEIAVLLNELAYMKYEASQTLLNHENVLLKQRNVGVAFSLVEKTIKLVSDFGEGEELNAYSIISENTFTKIISGLNETIGIVLEYLQDAKEHGRNKGDDLLASVRIIGSYLAEAPHACREKIRELLGYMLSVEGEDEPSPFYSICFLLPLLCQITANTDGCELFASSGAVKKVVKYLIILTTPSGCKVEDNGSILLACDTVLNYLLQREAIRFPLDDPGFIKILGALSHWAEDKDDPSIIMTASSVCVLVLDIMSEESLLHHPDFNREDLFCLSNLIRKGLAICGQDLICVDAKVEMDLSQIIASGYSRWADRFPSIKEAIER